MPQIGPLEIVMVLVVALLVFGPKKLPEVGKQAARGLRELRRFQSGLRSDLQGMLDPDDEPPKSDDEPPEPVEATELDDAVEPVDPPVVPDEPPVPEKASGSEAPPADNTQ